MSGRGLTPEMKAASRKVVVRPTCFVRLDLDSGILRMSDLTYEFQWDDDGGNNPKVWLGARGLGRISGVQTGVEMRAYGISLTLSGIPTNERLALALTEPVQGRRGWMWRGLMDEGHRLIPSPKLWFAGRIDTMPILLGDETSELTVTIFNRLIDWERAQGERYNDACQQARYPGDKFFEFGPQTVDKELNWGQQ